MDAMKATAIIVAVYVMSVLVILGLAEEVAAVVVVTVANDNS